MNSLPVITNPTAPLQGDRGLALPRPGLLHGILGAGADMLLGSSQRPSEAMKRELTPSSGDVVTPDMLHQLDAIRLGRLGGLGGAATGINTNVGGF